MIPHLVARRLCRPNNWTLLASTYNRSAYNFNLGLKLTNSSAFSTTNSFRTNDKSDTSEGEFRPSDELLKERYDLRSNEDLDRKRARLLYQSRKRGMLENGVILASFADKFLHQFDADQLDQYDRLINLPTNDWDIFYWATKTKPTPAEYETPVMAKLREHLKSKVSKSSIDSQCQKSSRAQEGNSIKEENQHESKPDEGGLRYSVLGKTRPDDIVVKPSAQKKNPMTFEVSEVSTVDFKDELYDDGYIRFQGGNYVQRMTDWRKKMIASRIKRSLSAPISARNMTEAKCSSKIYTQYTANRSVISGRSVPRKLLIDSKRERLLKHHNFMQRLLSSEFTDNVVDYDDEAEAWAEMVWHRNYGQVDDKISPTQLKCNSCAANLHCCDTGLSGYVPKEILSKYMSLFEESRLTSEQIQSISPPYQTCQRCSFTDTYDATMTAEVHKDFYIDYLESLRTAPRSIVCILVDLTDLPGSLWPGLLDHIGNHHRVIVIGNKLDLLPYDGGKLIERVTYSLRKTLFRLKTTDKNLRLRDVVVISARTGFGVDALVARLWANSEEPRDIHLIGCNNSGKSTLFNALAQSDISAIRQGDLIGRMSTYECPGTHMKMLRFPAALPEDWQIEVKKRRLECVERDYLRQERTLSSQSRVRQETMPHMSMLINRLEFDPLQESSTPTSALVGCNTSTSTVTTDQMQSVDEREAHREVNEKGIAMQMSSIVTREVDRERNLGVKFTEDHPMANIHENEPLASNEIKYPEPHRFVYHSPSCYSDDQLYSLLTNEERLEVFPNETIVPRKYSLRPLQTILISGLGRLDLLTSQSNVILNVFVSRYLPIHVISTRKADEFYNTFLGSPYLGIPFGDSTRLTAWTGLRAAHRDFNIIGKGLSMGSADVVLSSIGWILVNLTQDQECIVRAHTPGAKGIFLRDPPLLAFANRPMGKKLRDTPLFKHPHYTITETEASNMGNPDYNSASTSMVAASRRN